MAAVHEYTFYINDGTSTHITADTFDLENEFPSPSTFDWSRDGYTFDNWNTSSDGNGVAYYPDDTLPNADGTYYAIWTATTPTYDVTVSYNGDAIAQLSDSGSVVLATEETFVTNDIIISYTKPTPTIALQSKTVSPSESAQTVTPDSGYDGLSQVSVGAISKTYVGSQVPRQSAQTITPTTTDQTIASGKYLTGAQTIKGDANLISGNIAIGISIFGVTGTYGGGNITIEPLSVTSNGTYTASAGTAYSPVTVSVSGGGDDGLKGFIENYGTMTNCTNSSVSTIGSYAFAYCPNLTTVSFPSCTSIGSYAFSSCSKLTTVSFPSCTSIGGYAFAYCRKLTTASFPSCTSISYYAFASCYSLTTVSFPLCRSMGNYAFAYCSSLTTASFPSCTSMGNYAFANCSKLTTVSFPSCTSIGNYAFSGCSSLTTVSFPLCRSIGSNAFGYCRDLTTASFPSCTSIGSYAFNRCYNLISLYLTGSSVANLVVSNAFTSTPIGGYTTSTGGVYGSIFVPSSLYDTYKSSTNWSYFSSRFASI